LPILNDDDPIRGHYDLLQENITDIFLFPVQTCDLLRYSNLSYSSAIIYAETVAILSSYNSNSHTTILSLMNTFSPLIWLIILFTIIVLTTIHLSATYNLCDSYLMLLLGQPISLYRLPSNLNNSIGNLLIFWLLVSTILQFSFRGVMRRNIMFTKCPQIDSLNDLVERENISIIMFYDDENVEYFNRKDTEITEKLSQMQFKFITDEYNQNDSQISLFESVLTGENVIITDRPYLEYYHAKLLHLYPSLYLSRQSYFSMPLSLHLSPKMSKSKLNQKFEIL